MPYSGPILLTGDMVASVAGASQTPGLNPGDPGFGMRLTGVTALGMPNTTYRLVWTGNNANAATEDEFHNGQFWTLEHYTGPGQPQTDTAASSWQALPGYTQLSPRNDIVGGVGAGDDYVVFDTGNGFLLYDTNGGLPASPTDLFYDGATAAQNGDPGTGDEDSDLDFADSYGAYCFCAGTMIEAAGGPRRVEDLAVGAPVLTPEHGLQPIRWIGRRQVSVAETVAHPRLLPVRIAAGALGPGLPARELWLSPQHRVLVHSAIARRMAGPAGALVAVIHLVGLPGIDQPRGPRAVEYLHLRLDRHDLVRAEGIWAETLFLGREALRAMTPAARRELRMLFPDLPPGTEPTVRPVLPGRAARRLADRHARQAQPLLDTLLQPDGQSGSISPSARRAWKAATNPDSAPAPIASRRPCISC